MADILIAQVDAFKPDVLFMHGWELGGSFVQALRRRFPCLKKIVGYDGIARHSRDCFVGTDIVLAPLRESVRFYQTQGFIGHLFKLGFNADVLRFVVRRSHSITASFVGSVCFGGHGHNERLRLLDYVRRRCPLQLYLAIQPASQVPRIVASNVLHCRIPSWCSLISDINAYYHLARDHRPAVFGKEMYQTMADSAISLNCHIDAAGTSAGNIRLFEATGVGSCLLTDWKSNLQELFEIDREVLTFRSPKECVDKLTFLIQNPRKREAVARAGQQRTLRDHNVQTEIAGFAETLAHLV
jgi:hypothetical protein